MCLLIIANIKKLQFVKVISIYNLFAYICTEENKRNKNEIIVIKTESIL